MASWMTFADLKERVADLCDDAGLDDVIASSINESYRDMMNCDPEHPLWFRRKRASFNLVANTRAYTDQEAVGGASAGALASAGITDLGRILSMSVGGFPCKEITPAYLDKNASTLWNDTNTEDHPAYHFHETSFYSSAAVAGPPPGTRTRLYLNTINFFLMPRAAKTVRLTYESTFTLLSADTDIPQLPSEYHHGLVYGAMVMMEMFGKSSISSTWAAIYASVKSNMMMANRRTFNNLQPVDPWVAM